MAGSIEVQSQVLIDTAKKVRSCNATMDSKLADIKAAMNALESSWKSDAASDIRAAMNALQPRFDQYKDVVESYAKFLDTTAQNYETTETSVQNTAAAFK